MFFGSLFGLVSNDIGIDLGTANTLVYVKDHGIVLRDLSEKPARPPASIVTNLPADNTCAPAPIPTPVPPANHGVSLLWNVGVLAAGASQQVVIRYDRY